MKRGSIVLMDACVLVPMPLADTLLRLAAGPRLYLPKWSDQIMVEVTRTLQENFGLSPQKAMYRESEIRRHFPEAWIDGYEDLIPAMTNHPKDRHVLAPAARAGVKVIVTYNLKDFPSSSLAPYAITAQGPSAFLKSPYDMAPSAVIQTLETQAAAISQPMSYLLSRLSVNAPAFVGMIEKTMNRDEYALNFHDFKAWQPFTIGDFTITPYLVDHSATDAYAFLIEAEGKRLFYSGDLRSHGRKGILFENLVKRPIRDIDILFLEGTMLHRSNDQFPDETAVEDTIFQTIRDQKNISFLLASSQNIDRIVSAFRACKRVGKLLVIDIYTAWGLEQLRQVTQNTPAMDWPEIRVFARYSQDEILKTNPDYFGDFRKRLYRHRVMPKELRETPEAFLYFGKMSGFRFIDKFKNAAAPVNVIYSQWLGYLDGSHPEYFGSDKISRYRSDPEINFIYAHSSGHAPLKDLQKLAAALKPKMLIPIHTEDAEGFRSKFENVTTLMDGETFVLD